MQFQMYIFQIIYWMREEILNISEYGYAIDYFSTLILCNWELIYFFNKNSTYSDWLQDYLICNARSHWFWKKLHIDRKFKICIETP